MGALRAAPDVVMLGPRPSHHGLLGHLLIAAETGNLTTDAYLAALTLALRIRDIDFGPRCVAMARAPFTTPHGNPCPENRAGP